MTSAAFAFVARLAVTSTAFAFVARLVATSAEFALVATLTRRAVVVAVRLGEKFGLSPTAAANACSVFRDDGARPTMLV